MKEPSPNYYSAVVVIDNDGKVLLGKRKEDGIWTTPAGGESPGEENPVKTAVRELFEEAGIAADPRFLQPLPSIQTKNGKFCHCFLYVVGPGTMSTSKLDPDEEVGKWKWFKMDEIPNGLKDDPRRFESVRNAYMKFHGIQKSIIDTLEKGGKPAQVGEIRNFAGRQFQKMGDGTWIPYVHKEEKQLQAEQSKKEPTTQDKLKEKIAEKKQVSHSEQHLDDLKNQAIVEGKELRSGKPIFTSVDSALAHKYKPEDFIEASHFFNERATKMGENIQRLKTLQQPVDPNFEKIRKENIQLARLFMNQAVKIKHRNIDTKVATHATMPEMVKSNVAVGHLDAAEINTGSFANEHKHSLESNWLEKMTKIMDGYSYGDEPRMIPLDKGNLYLVKVDDGIYSGVFKTIKGGDSESSPEAMVDNAKVRLERMTLPTMVQFCLAKEWINSFKTLDPVTQAGMRYAAEMDYYGGQLESMDRDDNTTMNLVSKLEEPKVESESDKKLRILELLNKLVN